MKRLVILNLLFFALMIWSCGSKNNSKTNIEALEANITEEGCFWQSSYGNTVDCLFLKNGVVKGLVNGYDKIVGKWAFDKSTNTFQVAWEGGKQYIVTVDKVEPNWSMIKFSDEIHSAASSEYKKMKLLDNRF